MNSLIHTCTYIFCAHMGAYLRATSYTLPFDKYLQTAFQKIFTNLYFHYTEVAISLHLH